MEDAGGLSDIPVLRKLSPNRQNVLGQLEKLSLLQTSVAKLAILPI